MSIRGCENKSNNNYLMSLKVSTDQKIGIITLPYKAEDYQGRKNKYGGKDLR